MTIKFNKFNITNGKTKARVSYSAGNALFIGNKVVMQKHVTIYEKDYDSNLSKIFAETTNDTDAMTDYFAKDRVRFNEGHKFYEEALKRANA